MGFGIFLVEALSGMGWQLYIPHFAQILCTMSFGTRNLVGAMGAVRITIVMVLPASTACRVHFLSFAEIQAGATFSYYLLATIYKLLTY